ncbi:MAG: regulatory protein RecX [Proteobacteria bacterium]|nr:regulatory protein RecX [Pseudomonadota bacterium]
MPPRSPSQRPIQTDDPVAIRLAAVALLARRDFSAEELRRKLLDRGFAEGAVRAVLGELSGAGLLDEARYVESYVRAHVGRGHGPARIRADLRRNGVPDTLIEAALDPVDWLELARKVRRAKFGARSPQDWTEKARQARFLQYRGFSADHIRSATGADPDLD